MAEARTPTSDGLCRGPVALNALDLTCAGDGGPGPGRNDKRLAAQRPARRHVVGRSLAAAGLKFPFYPLWLGGYVAWQQWRAAAGSISTTLARVS